MAQTSTKTRSRTPTAAPPAARKPRITAKAAAPAAPKRRASGSQTAAPIRGLQALLSTLKNGMRLLAATDQKRAVPKVAAAMRGWTYPLRGQAGAAATSRATQGATASKNLRGPSTRTKQATAKPAATRSRRANRGTTQQEPMAQQASGTPTTMEGITH